MPTAELEVYYGFTKNFVRMHGQEQVDRYMEQLKQPGVSFHGTYRPCSLSIHTCQRYLLCSTPCTLLPRYCGHAGVLPVANQVLDRSIRRIDSTLSTVLRLNAHRAQLGVLTWYAAQRSVQYALVPCF